MICRPKNGLVFSNGCSNIFLFFQCINEMTFYYSPDTYKAKTMNVHSLCRELLTTYSALCKTGGEEKYYKKYIIVIIDELLANLKDDIVAKEILGGRYKKIVSLLEESKSNRKVFENTVRNLNGYFENYRYYTSLVTHLVNLVCGNKNQKEIIECSGRWISELLLLGYSRQHIYNAVSDFFAKKEIKDGEVIKEFFDCFKFEKRKWEFLIPADERIAAYLGSLKKLSEINDVTLEEKSIDELLELLKSKEYSTLASFVEKMQLMKKLYGIKILKCTCSALDPYSGMEYVQGYLKFLTNIIVTVDNETKQIFTECVCLNYNKKNLIIKAATQRRNRVFAQSYLPNVIKLLKNLNVSDDIYALLMKIFGYHGDAITTGLETKYALTMLWTALETLFVNDDHNTNKGETVKKALLDIIQRTYIIKCLKNLHMDFIANVKASDKGLIAEYNLESFPTFVEAMFDDEDREKREKLEQTLENNPLLRTRVYCLVEQNLKNGKSIQKLLEVHREKISQQIERIYRNRYFLIHAGEEFWYAEDIVECLHNYLDFVINYIIVKMEAGEGIVDIYDIIEEAHMDNELHEEILKNNKDIITKKDNYITLLFGPSDNVLQYYTDHVV